MSKKRALVLGASQGIGQATAKQLSEQDFAVTLFARSEDKLQATHQSLNGQGHDIFVGDISDQDTWLPGLRQRHEAHPYSVVILNSGGPAGGPISKAQPEDFLQAMTNHLVANSIIVREVMDFMKQQHWGRILTVTSTSVKIPIPHLGVSNTARAAVASWGKTLSLELAPFHITVNNVMPGFTMTPRLEKLIKANAESTGREPADVAKDWMGKVPMGRFADPSETASLIRFLCSDEAGYITGQSIAVDGGRVGCL